MLKTAFFTFAMASEPTCAKTDSASPAALRRLSRGTVSWAPDTEISSMVCSTKDTG